MGERIEVNSDVIKREISNLKSVVSNIQADKGITKENNGKGYTKEYMDIVSEGFNGIKNTLQGLIENTVVLLENISDGYIEMDEAAAKRINEFTSEILNEMSSVIRDFSQEAVANIRELIKENVEKKNNFSFGTG